ncbi:MAG: ABC transporter permease subunit [Gemmatimonadaceae bacterium]|nr:ABC transporter permease subunit [Gemmatimonadaceae bacterium]
MHPLQTIIAHQWRDLSRNRWILGYTGGFLLITELLLRIGGGGPRMFLSLLNILIAVVPLATGIFATVYWFGAREFNEFLLAQPVARATLFLGLYIGLVAPLAAAVGVGIGLPLLIERALDATTAPLLLGFALAGVGLTAVFASLAVLVCVVLDDRFRSVGAMLLLWAVLTIGWDAFVLLAATTLSDWPLETPLLVATALNPIDIARVSLVLQLDIAAMLGYTGAVFQRAFGGWGGISAAAAILCVWAVAPALLARRAFERRDF